MRTLCHRIIRMVDARKIILDRLKERGLTREDLAQMVKDHIPRSTVYAFLAGTNRMNHESLGYILSALHLTIKPDR